MSADGEAVAAHWRAQWPAALAIWSPFTRLGEPRFCTTSVAAATEGLRGSFAMIRLNDHAVVIDCAEISRLGVAGFAREILAHEVGHHVLAPADLRDQARLLVRVRAGLPGLAHLAPMVANLWTDLLINDRLQRSRGLDMAGVYRALGVAGRGSARSWQLYLRICEELWRLDAGTLADVAGDSDLIADARLGARTVRVYARDWLAGASRFACLLQPYLAQEADAAAAARAAASLLDACAVGAGAEPPDGLATMDEGEDEAMHPAEDPAIVGDDAQRNVPGDRLPEADRAPDPRQHQRQRDPPGYVAVMAGMGVAVSERDLVMRYYRELALPHLVPFPARVARRGHDPLPEGLETWDLGSPTHEIDWMESTARGGRPIPGVTTLRRTWGESVGPDVRREPLDLYLGIDCSGSMGDPARSRSWPIVAGAVMALSALRARAKVWACLSGEPGEHAQTAGFVRDERAILATLTDYLGTGYSFGIERLRAAFLVGTPPERATHLLVLSDSDWFDMLDRGAPDGWEVARRAAEVAGGGASAVLRLPPGSCAGPIARLESIGWSVHRVCSDEELVAFARAFSRTRWLEEARR
ncbi:MAG TPA: VWA domain-containing protein [Planctomycetota bacterium]|nr:VWA domain-containing protein [Planctomycetota bacterium]